MSDLFARDGHLHDLSVDRLLLDECSPTERAELHAHADTCEPCTARIADARAFAETPLPPLTLSQPAAAPVSRAPAPPRPASPPPDNVVSLFGDRRVWTAGAGVMLMAAMALFFLRPPIDVDETFTTRGQQDALTLEVYRSTSGSSERLRSGSAVHPGDRLGFRVRSKDAGRLLIFGTDQTGSAYPCYPQQTGSDAPIIAAPVNASADSEDIDAAVRLDGTPGLERIIALRCDAPFSLSDVSTALPEALPDGSLPLLREGCTQDTVVLHKQAGASP